MGDVTIDKAENGYIFRHRGKTYIAESFGDLMYKCALAFDEKEVIAMRHGESDSTTDGDRNQQVVRAHSEARRKPGRPKKKGRER